MTQTEYSRHKNVELAAVKRAITEGRIPEHAIKIGSNQRKLIIWEEADKFWEESTIINNKNEHRQKSLNLKDDAPKADVTKQNQSQPSQAGNKLTDYRTVREGYAAKMAQIEYEKMIGDLTPTVDVKKAASEIGTNIKAGLELFADKLSPVLAAETDINKVHKILNDEVRKLLTNFSRGDYSFLEGVEL